MRKNEAPPQQHRSLNAAAVRKIHHASLRRIKDREGHYDIDGVSQLQNYQVVVASEDKFVPPHDFTELYERVKMTYHMTHHN